jgi:hypothetical protein
LANLAAVPDGHRHQRRPEPDAEQVAGELRQSFDHAAGSIRHVVSSSSIRAYPEAGQPSSRSTPPIGLWFHRRVSPVTLVDSRTSPDAASLNPPIVSWMILAG